VVVPLLDAPLLVPVVPEVEPLVPEVPLLDVPVFKPDVPLVPLLVPEVPDVPEVPLEVPVPEELVPEAPEESGVVVVEVEPLVPEVEPVLEVEFVTDPLVDPGADPEFFPFLSQPRWSP
jgi:hypothetical protein